jgi:nitrogen regulatory protein P-II 2
MVVQSKGNDIMIQFTQTNLVTIIAEDELEQPLVADLRSAGVMGYTVFKVRGEGMRRARTDEWNGENIQIEIIASPAIVQRIFECLAERYFGTYGVTAYVSEVRVVRAEKYQ